MSMARQTTIPGSSILRLFSALRAYGSARKNLFLKTLLLLSRISI
jgi:hypothetical protein